MPTCYTKTNLEQCSFTKKLIPIMPSEDTLEEGFAEMCKHKESKFVIRQKTLEQTEGTITYLR